MLNKIKNALVQFFLWVRLKLSPAKKELNFLKPKNYDNFQKQWPPSRLDPLRYGLGAKGLGYTPYEQTPKPKKEDEPLLSTSDLLAASIYSSLNDNDQPAVSNFPEDNFNGFGGGKFGGGGSGDSWDSTPSNDYSSSDNSSNDNSSYDSGSSDSGYTSND